jgi:hypothetical protein
MITFDAGITIYSNLKSGRQSSWTATQIHGCSWHGKQGATVGDGGLQNADQYAVRVPESRMQGYIGPDSFNALQQQPEGAWTVQLGDVIVRGLVSDKVANGISEITGKYTDCFTVTGVYDNRRGMLRHLRIEGK